MKVGPANFDSSLSRKTRVFWRYQFSSFLLLTVSQRGASHITIHRRPVPQSALKGTPKPLLYSFVSQRLISMNVNPGREDKYCTEGWGKYLITLARVNLPRVEEPEEDAGVVY